MQIPLTATSRKEVGILDKNPHAVALGRLGGMAATAKKKGLAALSAEERKEIARQGAFAMHAERKRKKAVDMQERLLHTETSSRMKT